MAHSFLIAVLALALDQDQEHPVSQGNKKDQGQAQEAADSPQEGVCKKRLRSSRCNILKGLEKFVTVLVIISCQDSI